MVLPEQSENPTEALKTEAWLVHIDIVQVKVKLLGFKENDLVLKKPFQIMMNLLKKKILLM